MAPAPCLRFQAKTHLCLQGICKVHTERVAPRAAALTATCLAIFPTVANDVSLREAIESLLETVAAAPNALPAMAREGVPLLMRQLQAAVQEGGPQGSFLVEGTLDLLGSFISSSDLGAHPAPRPAFSATKAALSWVCVCCHPAACQVLMPCQ